MKAFKLYKNVEEQIQSKSDCQPTQAVSCRQKVADLCREHRINKASFKP